MTLIFFEYFFPSFGGLTDNLSPFEIRFIAKFISNLYFIPRFKFIQCSKDHINDILFCKFFNINGFTVYFNILLYQIGCDNIEDGILTE